MRTTILSKMFRLLALPTCVLLLTTSPAQAVVMCTQSVAAVVALDPADTSAALPNIDVDCSGGAASDPDVNANLQIFFNAALLTDVLPTLTDGANLYSGIINSGNSALFLGIPIVPLATTLTLMDLFVDATLLAPGFSLTEFLIITSAPPILLSNPALQVAVVGEPAGNVPEPSSLLLLVAACAALIAIRPRRRLGATGAGASS